eukprot:scaffold92088_cov63-Phaeocystis_antarctica.AAC.1
MAELLGAWQQLTKLGRGGQPVAAREREEAGADDGGGARHARRLGEAARHGGWIGGPRLDRRRVRRQLELACGAAAGQRERRKESEPGVETVGGHHGEAARDSAQERTASRIVGVLAQHLDAAGHPERSGWRAVTDTLGLQLAGRCRKQRCLGRGVGCAHALRGEARCDGAALRVAQDVAHRGLAEIECLDHRVHELCQHSGRLDL